MFYIHRKLIRFTSLSSHNNTVLTFAPLSHKIHKFTLEKDMLIYYTPAKETAVIQSKSEGHSCVDALICTVSLASA